ncbi:MAG: hypothetical protein IJ532_04275 [Alphaproteobacteria bacterium]|nr:hypothetical protein [Alphaproteobacteria bacterium]
MLKSITFISAAAITLLVCQANCAIAQTANSQPRFLILRIAEQPQQIVAGDNTSQNSGVWDKTKEVSSDVWDGTKEVSSDVWDGTKTVTGDVWDGAKEVGKDVKSGLSDDSDTKTTTDNNNIQKQGEN